MTIVEALAPLAIDRLFTASVQGGLVLVCVWLVTRRDAGPRPSVRAWLWWLACLKLLVLLAGVPGVPLPVLAPGVPGASREAATHVRVPAPSTADTAAARVPVVATIEGAGPPAGVAPIERAATRQWPVPADLRVAVIALWGAGVATAFGHLFLSFRRMRRVAARSHAIGAEGRHLAIAIAARLGLRRVPDVRISHEAHAPQVAGAWRPVIVIPASAATQWTRDDLRMALCHELAHVRRRDLLYGWIPVLASRLFFFHPLAHLATREYLLAREAACDAIVLQTLQAEPAPYGRLLLRLGVVAPQSALAAGGTSATASGLKRRLEMLNRASFAVPAAHRWLIAAAVSLALVPLDLVSRAEASPNGEPAPEAEADRRLLAPQGVQNPAPDRSQEPAAPSDGTTSEPQPRARASDRPRWNLNDEPSYVASYVPSHDGAAAWSVERNSMLGGLTSARQGAEQEPAAGTQQTQEPAEAGPEARPEQVSPRNAQPGAAARADERRRELRAVAEAIEAAKQEAAAARNVAAVRSAAEKQQLLLKRLEAVRARIRSAELAANAAMTRDFLAGEVGEVEARVMQDLAAQLEAVARQQETLARQQQALVEGQRQLAGQIERIRELGEVLEQLREERER